MILCSDYSCIWHVVYHNRKININFREMVSEVTAVYSIVQVQSPNTLSSCLPSTSQLYWLSWKITSVKLNYSKSVRLDEISLIDTQRTRLYHNLIWFLGLQLKYGISKQKLLKYTVHFIPVNIGIRFCSLLIRIFAFDHWKIKTLKFNDWIVKIKIF